MNVRAYEGKVASKRARGETNRHLRENKQTHEGNGIEVKHRIAEEIMG